MIVKNHFIIFLKNHNNCLPTLLFGNINAKPLYERKKVLYNILDLQIEGAANVNCMKCGKQIEDAQVFCGDCLAKMKQYPIKPGTVVQLPYRAEEPAAKKPVIRKKALTPEELIARQRKIIQILCVIAAALVAALALTAAVLVRSVQLRQQSEQQASTRRSYNAVIQIDETR